MTSISSTPSSPSLATKATGPGLENLQSRQIIQNSKAETEFNKQEDKFTKIIFAAIAAAAVPTFIATLKNGFSAPSQVLRIIGDLFGSAATIATPYFMGKNELNNYKDLKTGNEEKRFFDNLREGFYRCCSLGFTPFIFEKFIDPKTWGKSIFHKGANLLNLLNLGFTGYTWGYGNFR